MYVYVTHTATVGGKASRRLSCVGCATEYAYEVTREATGGGHSSFGLTNSSAALKASERAKSKLAEALDEAVEPVSCPSCGIYQPDMERVLRARLGPSCDPNKWASMRASVPWELVWREVSATDTLEMYERFVDMWPSHAVLAEDRIRELKHPVLRKSASILFWLVWSAVALVAVALFVVLPLLSRYLGW